MPSALETFRAQREAAEQVHAQLQEVTALLRGITDQIQAVVHDEQFRKLLAEERGWLAQSSEFVNQLRWHRESEMRRFWPWAWRRWTLVMLLSVTTAFAGGAGYVWAIRPHEAELVAAREEAAWAASLAHRVIKMTPLERRQFDALMK